MTFSRLLVLAGVAAVFGLSGCSSRVEPTSSPSPSAGQDRSAPDTTATVPPETTSTSTFPESVTNPGGPSTGVEDEVVRRYVEFWEARRQANKGVPNPTDAGLAELATGEQLAVVIRETQHNLENGLAFEERKMPARIRHVRVVEIVGDRARVQECVVDDDLIVRSSSGEIVDDTIATHNVMADLERIEGAWRVSSVRLVQRWEGVDGCALAS
jgi:hypothetical protein